MLLFVDIRRGGASSQTEIGEEENSSENDLNSGESDKNVDNSGDLSTSDGSGSSGSSESGKSGAGTASGSEGNASESNATDSGASGSSGAGSEGEATTQTTKNEQIEENAADLTTSGYHTIKVDVNGATGGSLSYKAAYNFDLVTVSYDNIDASSDLFVNYGYDFYLTCNLEKKGYKFIGWEVDCSSSAYYINAYGFSVYNYNLNSSTNFVYYTTDSPAWDIGTELYFSINVYNELAYSTFTALWEAAVYSVTYDVNGGDEDSLEFETDYCQAGDTYGKTNLYDPSLCVLASGYTLVGNVFFLSVESSTSVQYFNFHQTYTGNFASNTVYTVVCEILYVTGSPQVVFCSPDDASQTDLSSSGRVAVFANQKGVYSVSFTTKSSSYSSDISYDFRSYIRVDENVESSIIFRISLFVGYVTVDENFVYAECGSQPSSNVLQTPTRSVWQFEGWNTEQDGSGTTISATDEFNFSSDITLYAQWSLPYNDDGGFWYFEDGYMPQSYYGTDAPSGIGESSECYSVSITESKWARVLIYEVDENSYAHVTMFCEDGGELASGWFNVEPIVWIVGYGDEEPESITTAVSAYVLTCGQVTSSISSGWSWRRSSLLQSLQLFEISAEFDCAGQTDWAYDSFASTLSQTVVNNDAVSVTSVMTVASVDEIDALCGAYATQCTDFVAFLLSGGTSTDGETYGTVDYWTRDLAYELGSDSYYGASSFDGIYRNGVYVTEDGVISNASLKNVYGARLSVSL